MTVRAAVYAHAARLPGIEVTGIDMHIGSQITELQPFADAFRLLKELVETLRADGHTIEHVDIGGGLGIPYKDSNDIPPAGRLCRCGEEPAARP
jgi:diaminopimelate decarboxylase